MGPAASGIEEDGAATTGHLEAGPEITTPLSVTSFLKTPRRGVLPHGVSAAARLNWPLIQHSKPHDGGCRA